MHLEDKEYAPGFTVDRKIGLQNARYIKDKGVGFLMNTIIFCRVSICRLQDYTAQLYWNVVQSEERRTVNPYVAGSIPAIPATPHNANIEAREVKH